MDLGPHAIFIWLCYGAVGLGLAGMILAAYVEGRALARKLAELEIERPRGITRDEASRG